MLSPVTVNRKAVLILVLVCGIALTSFTVYQNEFFSTAAPSGYVPVTYLPNVSDQVFDKMDEKQASEIRDFVNEMENKLRKQAKREAMEYNAIARNTQPPVAPRDLGDPQKIMILSASDFSNISDPRWNVVQQSLQSRDEYASRYGFHHRFVNISGHPAKVEHPVWLKLPVIEETFEKHPEVEWIWWLDIDALIVNHNLDLRSHILHPSVLKERLTYNRLVSNIDDTYLEGSVYPHRNELNVEEMLFVFTHDRISINAGSFFIKRSPLTNQVLKLWQRPEFMTDENGNAAFLRREQDAFIYLYFGNEDVRKRTALVAQPLMNSYPDLSKKEQAYRKGDFVVHFAGFWEYQSMLDDWPKYWKQAVRTFLPKKRAKA